MPWAPKTHRAASQPPKQRQSISRQKCKKLYGSNKWREASLRFRREHPLCQSCQERGIVRPSKCTDHVIPHRGSEVLFWDESNWAALCDTCHAKKSGLEARE